MTTYPAQLTYSTSPGFTQTREVWTADDLVRVYQDAGSHFFDRDTMRFFRSRLADDCVPLADGTIGFLTTECGPDGIRRATVRIATDDTGTIDTREPHGFQAFASLRQARAALRRYADGIARTIRAADGIAVTP